MKAPNCHRCGRQMDLLTTNKLRYPNGAPRKFYGCPAYPRCRSTVGAHPDGTPVGVPADHHTKRARMRAHVVFDGYWKKHGLTRGDGYKIMRDVMGLPDEKAHIGHFDLDQCNRVIEIFSSLPPPSRSASLTVESRCK